MQTQKQGNNPEKFEKLFLKNLEEEFENLILNKKQTPELKLILKGK